MTGLRLAGQERSREAYAANAPDQVRAQVGRLHHRVDDELGGQVQDVDLRLVLGAQLLGAALALGGVLDRLELVVEDRVDRGLRAHHGDLGVGQRDAGVRVEGGPGHRVEAGAVGLAHDHRQLRHGRLGDGGDHLGARADDALALDLGADHEAGHVGQEQQRDVEGVAGPDEAGRLVGRVDEQDAAALLGLVGDDPDRAAVEPRVADDQLLRPALLHLEEGAGVHQRRRSARACRTACSRPPGCPAAAPRGWAGGAVGGSSRQLTGK